LIDEKAVSALERFGPSANLIGEIDGLLVDVQLLKPNAKGALRRKEFTRGNRCRSRFVRDRGEEDCSGEAGRK